MIFCPAASGVCRSGQGKANAARQGCLSRYLALVVLLSCVTAQGQITVSGIADKSVYTGGVTFTIVTQAGYDYQALLNGIPAPVGTPVVVTRVDYHELQIFRTNQISLEVTNQLIRFIVRSAERGGSEDGLPPWTPYPLINSASNEFAGAQLWLIIPQDFPAGYDIPVVAWVKNEQGRPVRVNGPLTAPGQNIIQIRRGVGSGFLSSNHPPGTLIYAPRISQLQASNLIQLESNVTWTTVSGALNGNTVWPANARIAVTGNLTIPAAATLTIGEGAVVRLNAGVDIILDGQLTINGVTNRPVVFMPANRSQPWGGFLLQANTSQLIATGVIFTGSGAVPNWFGTGGRPSSHRREQALFYCTNAPAISLIDCAAIALAGQLSHAVNGGTFTLTRFLMQRTTTGGEHTGASFRVNDSAFIECPDDTANFVDGDNDGLYLVNGTHGFTNTLFGWMKDDGVDSGGSGSGLIHYQDCWFDSIFHEGNSLSGTGKIVNHYGTVFINCGQGLEAGYSGPVGTLSGCLAVGNLVGGRFGDNYVQTFTGFLRATNSLLLYNYRDVWGFNQQDWTYRASAMDVHSNFLSAPNVHHPDNTLWQPDNDGLRLASFMSTPANADVGVGIALRATQLSLDSVTNGVPIRLSSFTTNLVSVNYAAQAPGETPVFGTLEFQPGETLKFIPLTAPNSNTEILRVQISSPLRGEITGADTAYFLRSTATVTALVSTGSLWRYLDTGEDAGNAWRTNGFNDSAWLSGPAELGYGDGDEATIIRSNGVSGRIITTYFRREFVVTNPAEYSSLTVNLRRDDGGVVYINGLEVFRSNMTNAPGVPIAYNHFAGNSTGSETAFFSTNVTAAILRAGTNVVAAEIHQNSLTSSDVSFELRLDATVRPALRQTRLGDDWLLYWDSSAAILEHADDLSGEWFPGISSSPFEVNLDQPQQFFRLRQPAPP